MGKSMERSALVAARVRKHWTQLQAATRIGVDWNTLSRWERGIAHPRAYYLDAICELYEMTAVELGLVDLSPFSPSLAGSSDNDDPLRRLACNDLSQRFMRLIVSWHLHHLHPYELQVQIMQATEENRHMNPNEEISRREALRRLALLPIDVYGLSVAGAALNGPFEEMIAHCSAGITACWYLRKGKELQLASTIVSAYIPTLQAIVSKAQTSRLRQAATSLLVQCFVLKATLARHVEGNPAAIVYAKQAVDYSEQADDQTMHVLALRTLASTYSYTDHWGAALTAAEQAQFLLEHSSFVAIPKIVHSYVYAGLANYQAHQGQKQPALLSLQKAHQTFFAEPDHEQAAIWIDHNQANLLLNDGLAHFHLGMQKEALDSFQKIDALPAKSELIRVETMIDEVLAELQREDKAQNMEWCIDRWSTGIEGAKALQSEQRFSEALTAYTVLRSVWPKEQRVKELRDLAVHW